MRYWLGVFGAVVLCAGCSAASVPNPNVGPDGSGTGEDEPRTPESFQTVLERFATYDRDGWTEDRCTDVAHAFLRLADRSEAAKKKTFSEARYNAALAFGRCEMHGAARTELERALKRPGGFPRAEAQLALAEHRRTGNLDRGIADLERAVRASRFQNVEALVGLAALQMQRRRSGSAERPGDLEEAKKNLQRALAIDDAFLPAYNQLALFHLQGARGKSVVGTLGRLEALSTDGSARPKSSRQRLELAALVTDQAIRKNADYAPIHNTAGLVLVELGDFSAAVRSFDRARRLDPKFFEAHMNAAAINLAYRGFPNAESAYRDALELRPADYEALLGLALALRGQLRAGAGGERLKEAESLIERARKLHPNRSEAYFNQAALYRAIRAKTGNDEADAKALRRAAELYAEFIARAERSPSLDRAVKHAREQREDIEAILRFRASASR